MLEISEVVDVCFADPSLYDLSIILRKMQDSREEYIENIAKINQAEKNDRTIIKKRQEKLKKLFAMGLEKFKAGYNVVLAPSGPKKKSNPFAYIVFRSMRG
jgi:hypothetical protein